MASIIYYIHVPAAIQHTTRLPVPIPFCSVVLFYHFTIYNVPFVSFSFMYRLPREWRQRCDDQHLCGATRIVVWAEPELSIPVQVDSLQYQTMQQARAWSGCGYGCGSTQHEFIHLHVQ